ncbi:Zinc transporter 1 [Bienertia sinuspersici]
MVAKASQIWQTILSLLLLSTTLKFVVAHSTHKTTECFCLREDKHDGHDHDGENGNTKEVLTYKIVAIVTILLASALGVFLPILGKNIPALRPERGTFILVKAYSAGIILCTAFIHILPEAFENLTSPCLGHDTPWDNFPFTGLAVMLGSLLTLVMDSMGSRHYSMSLLQDSNAANKEATDAYNNHGHGHCVTSTALPEGVSKEELIRFRITSHVLEIGIVVHSVIIGLSMGTSQKLDTIKPLIAALCFHQFFEGIGLGGCIVQVCVLT